jgi:predicted dehydrogenase
MSSTSLLHTHIITITSNPLSTPGNTYYARNPSPVCSLIKADKVNAGQAKALATLAKEKRLFLLEAVWTRFFPLSKQIRDLISSGALGTVHLVFADIGAPVDREKVPLTHRIFNPDLAGGSLLDIGVYSLTWVMQTIYVAQKSRQEKPDVTGSIVLVKETGVDDSATVVLTWKDGMLFESYIITFG